MILLPHELIPEWESPDASAFREFLATPTGRKIFPMLMDSRPSLKGDTLEAAGLQGKLVEGFDHCLKELSQLCSINQPDNDKQPVEAYPPLEDDSKWPGDKLNETTEK